MSSAMPDDTLAESMKRLGLEDAARLDREPLSGKSSSLRRGVAIPPPETLVSQAGPSTRGSRGQRGSGRYRGVGRRGGSRYAFPSDGNRNDDVLIESSGGKQVPRSAAARSGATKAATAPTEPSPLRNSSRQASQQVQATDTAVYIVQVVKPPRSILAVFRTLADANASALSYMSMVQGVPAEAISTNLGIFGQVVMSSTKAPPARGGSIATTAVIPLAGKRTCPDGTLQIVDTAGRPWMQVTRKEVEFGERATGRTGKEAGEEPVIPGHVFLSHDGTGIVVGANIDKAAAWEACKRYMEQLAYWDRVQDLDKWVDVEGMYHAMGKVGETEHHWYVKEWRVMPFWIDPDENWEPKTL